MREDDLELRAFPWPVSSGADTQQRGLFWDFTAAERVVTQIGRKGENIDVYLLGSSKIYYTTVTQVPRSSDDPTREEL